MGTGYGTLLGMGMQEVDLVGKLFEIVVWKIILIGTIISCVYEHVLVEQKAGRVWFKWVIF